MFDFNKWCAFFSFFLRHNLFLNSVDFFLFSGHLSSSVSGLHLQGNTSLVASKNLSANCFSNSFALESEEKNLKIQKTCLKSRLQSKKHRKNQRTRKGEKMYNCCLCDKFFSKVHDLKRHLRVHTGEKPFKCDVCDKTFSQAASLNRHQIVHRGEKPFRCDVCDKSFSQVQSLNTHKRVHSGEKPFRCDVCDKSFSLVHSLNTHKRVHSGEKPFRCDVCHKRFSLVHNLNTHKRVHSGEKPFNCDECDKNFSQAAHLNKHHKVHTKEKPFKCDVFEKSFSQRESLNRNKTHHTDDKPFKWDVCDKAFSVANILEMGQRVHTCEKLSKCDTCDKTFSLQHNLNTQSRIHTGEKPFKWHCCMWQNLLEVMYVRNAFLYWTIWTRILHTNEKTLKCDVYKKNVSYSKAWKSNRNLQYPKLERFISRILKNPKIVPSKLSIIGWGISHKNSNKMFFFQFRCSDVSHIISHKMFFLWAMYLLQECTNRIRVKKDVYRINLVLLGLRSSTFRQRTENTMVCL